jgi:hypothetical protein
MIKGEKWVMGGNELQHLLRKKSPVCTNNNEHMQRIMGNDIIIPSQELEHPSR